MGKHSRWMWLVLVLALWPLGCRPKAAERRSLEGVPVVRVRVLESQQRVTLAAEDPPAVVAGRDARPHKLDLPGSEPVTVELLPRGGWRFGSATLPQGEVTLVPSREGSVTVNGEAYRGRYRFVPRAGGRFDVVNDVDIDGYLKGVVPKEMLWNWHAEAYRAQAVIARTYALYQWRTGRTDSHFDLHADTRSQVYGGMGAENGKSREAVDATAGVVTAFGPEGSERIFKAYFSSCCGGVRQSAADAFNEPPHPALIDQNVGNLCNASPRFNWGPIVLTREELTRRFRLWGERKARPEQGMARIDRVDIQATNPSGRPVRFVITDARGDRYSLSGEELRWAVNTGAAAGTGLNSSFVKPVNNSQGIQFVDGHGWGHGVGMCQWCAQTQAGQGMRHEDIVLSAFPGAKLVRAY